MHTIEIHPVGGGCIRIQIEGAEGEPVALGRNDGDALRDEIVRQDDARRAAVERALAAETRDVQRGALLRRLEAAVHEEFLGEPHGTADELIDATIRLLRGESLRKLRERICAVMDYDEAETERFNIDSLPELVKQLIEGERASAMRETLTRQALDRMTLHAAKVVEAATTPNGVLLATGHGALDQTLRGLIGAGERNWWRDAIGRADEIPF